MLSSPKPALETSRLAERQPMLFSGAPVGVRFSDDLSTIADTNSSGVEDVSSEAPLRRRKVRRRSTLAVLHNMTKRLHIEDRSPDRQWARDFFNLCELQVLDLFEMYDADRTGYLDSNELALLLTDLNHGEPPTQDELEWVMKVADKDMSMTIGRNELLTAMQAWNGYVYLPEHLKVLFDRYDEDADGYLNAYELQQLLSELSGGTEVSLRDSKEVLEMADKLSDGKLGKYELLGALGFWYISVGRKPTPSMTLAFLANNRTANSLHRWLQYLTALVMIPTAYFPLVVAFGGTHECSVNIQLMLLVDGISWLVLGFIMVMKTNWVQLLTLFMDFKLAWQCAYQISWFFLGVEVLTITVLVVIEGIGGWWVLQEDTFTVQERASCEGKGFLPIDCVKSFKTLHLQNYETYLEFCKTWFAFNLLCNFSCLLAYYAYLAYAVRNMKRADESLMAPADDRVFFDVESATIKAAMRENSNRDIYDSNSDMSRPDTGSDSDFVYDAVASEDPGSPRNHAYMPLVSDLDEPISA